MGLFSSITKSISKVFKPVTKTTSKLLFGSPAKVSYTDPQRMISPPSWQEESLLNRLYPSAQRDLSRANRVGNMAYGGGYLQQATSAHSRLYGRTLRDLNKISRGKLPEPYMKATERLFNERLGGILNDMAKRGIVNSSVTQRSISDALQRASDLQVNYLGQAAQLAQMPYQFGTSQPLSMFGKLRGIEKDYQSTPYNLWNTLMTARHGVVAQPVVSEGSSGLAGPLGGAIGYSMYGPTGGIVGGLLGNSLASILR